MSARVASILQRKGYAVVTIGPQESLGTAAGSMTEHGVGSLVVTRDGRTVDGVLSERDVIRALARHGSGAIDLPVGQVTDPSVTICHPDTGIDELVVTMTQQRIRHLPVVEGGRLVGIVSIGDVVKWRMDELAMEARHLEAYVSGGY